MTHTNSSASPLPPPAARPPWLLCWLLFFATSLSFLDRQVLSILSPAIIDEFKMDNTTYSYVVAAFQLSYTVMFAVGGRLVDRFGTALGLGVAVAIWSLASGAHALAGGVMGLALGRFVLGFGEGACIPAMNKGAVEWFPVEKRVLAIGLANSGSAFGAVLAAPFTAGLAAWLGWRGVFVATAIMGVVWLAAWGVAIRKIKPTPVAAAAQSDLSWREILVDRRTWSLLASRFLFDPVFYFYMFWIPQYLARERGFSVAQIGASFWIPFLALGVSNILSGRVSQYMIERGCPPARARALLLGGAAAVTLVSWLVPFTPSAGFAVGLMTCLMFAHGFWISNYLGLIGDHYPRSAVATVTGLSGTAGGIAGVLSSLLIGPIVDLVSFTPVFVLLGLLYPAAVVILLRGFRRAAA